MSANRRTRDSILLEAIKMSEIPSLNLLDVSNGDPYTGTIKTTAITIGWLQDAIDLFQGRFPWAGSVVFVAGNFVAHSSLYLLPSNYIVDIRNGLFVVVDGKTRRVRRTGLQEAINRALNRSEGVPELYTFSGNAFYVSPTPDQSYVGSLWYYALAPALSGSTVPNFPSDALLVEYVRIRAMEWIRAVPPGSALRYAEEQVLHLRKAGLGAEPESEDIPLDTKTFIPGAGGDWASQHSWMGEVGA